MSSTRITIHFPGRSQTLTFETTNIPRQEVDDTLSKAAKEGLSVSFGSKDHDGILVHLGPDLIRQSAIVLEELEDD